MQRADLSCGVHVARLVVVGVCLMYAFKLIDIVWHMCVGTQLSRKVACMQAIHCWLVCSWAAEWGVWGRSACGAAGCCALFYRNPTQAFSDCRRPCICALINAASRCRVDGASLWHDYSRLISSMLLTWKSVRRQTKAVTFAGICLARVNVGQPGRVM